MTLKPFELTLSGLFSKEKFKLILKFEVLFKKHKRIMGNPALCIIYKTFSNINWMLLRDLSFKTIKYHIYIIILLCIFTIISCRKDKQAILDNNGGNMKGSLNIFK